MHPNVLKAYTEVLSAFMARHGCQELVLVGFSGGAGICALLAEHRTDVVFLATCAGNLSLSQWTTLCHLTPLYGSLDPLDLAPRLNGLPQRHYIAEEDTVVPPQCIETFCQQTGHPEACIRVPTFSHGSPWHTIWNYDYQAKSSHALKLGS